MLFSMSLYFRQTIKLLLMAIFIFPLLIKAVNFGLTFAPETISSHSALLIRGMIKTCVFSASAGLIGLILGIVLAILSLSSNFIVKFIVTIYIWLIRGTPLLIQILFVYYALPILFPNLKLSDTASGILALSLNVGTYNAEVIRGGILSISNGQKDAATSLGLNFYQTLRWILLPQTIQNTLPALGNHFAGLIKDSSLVSSIGILDLTMAGNRIISETFNPLPILLIIGIIYIAFTSFCSFFISQLEKQKFTY